MTKTASAAVYIRRPDGRIALCKRLTEPYRGYFGLVGGKVERGETSAAAVARETREEAGIGRFPERFKFLALNDEEENFQCALYLLDIDGETAPRNLEPEKHTDWQWYSPEEIFELDKIIPGVKKHLFALLINEAVARAQNFRGFLST